ncbi:hypothetical protein [Mycoplana ramosa]|uniref:Uncharacterized protein n=1 Tax=Mycoplana ramosa TaxID=40837 RepID=A0ABW3YUS5_MYCRA
MTDQQQSVAREGQRGFLGALLLMLALVVGQFVTLERKISFRPGAEPAVARTAAERASSRGALPRPLSAGGGASSSDKWLISSGDRRLAKAKSAGSGGDPSTDPAFVVSDEFVPVAPRPYARVVVSFADAIPAGTPRHDFEGRAPPARLL